MGGGASASADSVLHIAVHDGNYDKVVEIIKEGKVDINGIWV
jgi:hypothetical protein